MTRGISLVGSNWFDPRHGREMAALVGSGVLDFSIFEHTGFGLAQCNEALAVMDDRRGGFTNFVIRP